MVRLRARAAHHGVARRRGFALLHDRNARRDADRARTSGSALAHALERATVGAAFERQFVPSFGFGGASSSQELRGFVHDAARRNRLYIQARRRGAAATRSRPTTLELDTIWLRSTLGYAAARWLRVEALLHLHPPGLDRHRRRDQPPPRRRAVRRLTTHEDPVMEERRFHPLDYVSVLRRRKWWFIVPLVLCIVGRRAARGAAAARVHVRRPRSASPLRRCRPSCCAASVARRRGAAARHLAAAAEPHGARAGRPRGAAQPEQAGRGTRRALRAERRGQHRRAAADRPHRRRP